MNRRVGNRAENWVAHHLENTGHKVWIPAWGGRGVDRFRSTDIFGIFDVMGIRGESVRLVQVKKANSFRKKVEDEIRDFKVPSNFSKEYWTLRIDNGEARLRIYKEDGVVEKSIKMGWKL